MKFLTFLTTLSLLVLGCQKTSEEILRERLANEQRLQSVVDYNEAFTKKAALARGNENDIATPAGFDPSRLNLYFRDSLGKLSGVNFFDATYDFVRTRLEPSMGWREEALGDGRLRAWSGSLGDGLMIVKGTTTSYRILSNEFFVEGNISIGSPKAEVLQKYPNGFSQLHEVSDITGLPAVEPVYYYTDFSKHDGYWGKGLEFYFDDHDSVIAIGFASNLFNDGSDR